MRYEELQGNDEYVRQLVHVAMRLEEANPDFIVVPPGGMLNSEISYEANNRFHLNIPWILPISIPGGKGKNINLGNLSAQGDLIK